jgi:hypothetical protein
MSVGVHGFEAPYEKVQPTRDMVIIRIPMPPKMVGSVHLADATRELAQHNVMYGRIVAKGPLAFSYKDADGLQVQEANIGDWVVIRPFAGTMVQGGQIQVTGGWRYVSSFGDVIGVIPAEHMPDPVTLEWDMSKPAKPATPEAPAVDPWRDSIRERTIYDSIRERTGYDVQPDTHPYGVIK